MPQPQWDGSSGGWTVAVKCPAFGRLDALIKTQGQDDPPTETQLAALAMIERLPKTVRKPVRKSVRRYAKEYLGPEEYEELEPEDLHVEFDGALIPPLRNSKALYFFLQGNSDIDIEHGVACLCKNADTFRVCHTDAVYETYEWDAAERFEAMLGSRAVKLEKSE